MDSLLCYAGSGNDGAHRQINSFIWNSWTPDVAVTGGILDVDYASIVWPKINYLASPNLGLLPWYSPPTGNRGVRCLGLLLVGQDYCEPRCCQEAARCTCDQHVPWPEV